MIFEQLKEFDKDLKSLLKKYKSLEEDLRIVKKILEKLPNERPPFSYRLNNLGIETCVIKVKKIACKALKGRGVNSGFRLIYAYFPLIKESQDEEEKIIFIELYHKNQKGLEDRKRITKHFK